ncbi:MAG: DUF819 family protein, partial [Vicinamibacteria bacterium]
LGGVVASQIFHGWIGPETWKLGGAFAAAFVGGGMNFAAVGRGLQVSPDLFAAASVADNLSTVPWLLAQVGLYRVLTPVYRPFPESMSSGEAGEEGVGVDPREYWTSTSMNVTDMAILAAIPLGALWLSRKLSPLLPGFPEVLWLTTFALIVAQTPAVQRLKGAAVLSYFSLHLFFIVVGANSDVGAVVRAGPTLFLFMISIIVLHGLVIYGSGWLLGLDLRIVTLASQAAVGGPGSAMALSMAMRWEQLVTPGIIIGIFGYAIGNYLGFACSYLLRAIL